MMRKTKLAALISALVWGAAIGTTSTALAAVDQSGARSPASFYSHSSVAELLARHGADDPKPPKCDDHGTDLCNAGTSTLAKHGADDPKPPKCDDHGTDLCNAGTATLAKHGADDPKPPKCDDHGTDLCRSEA